ncbi:acetyltransferase [Jeotgalibacillus malaysiensis]|uniref:Acetyltransferase n=1 Tax=Jeotgalibacillus malaysiensis TaxID=1508404 RepID=A0A0B5AM23_9BACL|nr:GNAT family protein [Jeotgalibacillus malaysiensis]AJD89722.1 acetyltransferase [Jeotgalibacillus malaysiensis]
MKAGLPHVRLRDLKPEDAEARYRWMTDADVTAYLNVPDRNPPFTLEQTKEWIQQCINRTNGYEQKAIITDGDQHIGWADLKNIDQANRQAEVGIAIGEKQYWKRGYGQAAMHAILTYGFSEMGLHKIWLRVDIDNLAALESYRAIGFKEEGVMREDRLRKGVFVDRLRMSVLSSEWS